MLFMNFVFCDMCMSVCYALCMAENGGLGRYLPARWPSYASVRVSFFYVGVDF